MNRCVSYSTDGKWLISAGNDGTVRVWPTAGGDAIAILRSAEVKDLLQLNVSRGGTTIGAIDVDGWIHLKVRLWDSAPFAERLSARQELRKLEPEAKRLVDRLLDGLQEPGKAMARLQTDTTLGEPLQHAAWHELLHRREEKDIGPVAKPSR